MSSTDARKSAAKSAFGNCANCAKGLAGGFVLSHITCLSLLGLAAMGAVSAATVSSPAIVAGSAVTGLGGGLAFWARRRWKLAGTFEKVATPVSMVAGWSLAMLLMGGHGNHNNAAPCHPAPAQTNQTGHQNHQNHHNHKPQK